MKQPLLLLLALALSIVVSAQMNPPQSKVVQSALKFDVSPPLRDITPLKHFFWEKWGKEVEREVPNQIRRFPAGDPNFVDSALQKVYPQPGKAAMVAPIQNWDGLDNSDNVGGRVTPPDPAGDVGPNHYVQAVNSMLQIFNKTGTSLYGPVTTATIWSGFSGAWDGHNDGDAIILYDENADRWIISQFAVDCGTAGSYTEYELVAVSTTSDPTGSYYRYAFQFDYMPDYPKLGVWNDGYYLAVNRFNTNSGGSYVGSAAAVLERDKMLVGNAAARMVYFKTETLGGSGNAAGANCWAMQPSDCDGTMPASGTPNYFFFIDPSLSTSLMYIWQFHTDWTTTANCTFTYTNALTVSSFTALGSVSQSGTTNKLDALSDRLMFRNQYRNFGSYETFVTSHSVTSGTTGGIRWYEFRRSGGAISLYQQGTYAPADGKTRWMGSAAMNAGGDIGLIYTASSSSMFPSIYFTGRKSADALGSMTQTEGTIIAGTASITGATRWGDYTALNVDPVDNQTFWGTHEYVGTFGGSWPWATRIASFKFSNAPVVATTAASSIGATSATVNGTINPNGLASTYYFEWGTTIAYGNTTSSTSAGSGSTSVSVNAALSGLTTGQLYHYRIVGVNSDGTSNGVDMTFTPGLPAVSTTAASAITLNTATSGGNVTSDGGASITARGVCWATTANPTLSNSFTVDGTGTGVFVSNITGLSSNTLYHIRAYATNAAGTVYGDDLTFTTLCGVVTTFPWTEGFENAGVIPSCWSQEQVASSGLDWVFRAGSPSNTPSTAYAGSYNACLYDATTADNKTKLITPSLNLSLITSPSLTFYMYMKKWVSDQDQLIVYYRTSATGAWTQLASYTASVASWTVKTIALPNPSADYYIAFEGNAKYGYGVCVDAVTVSGTTPQWTGATSTDWNTASNWNNTFVPTTPTNVVIPTGVTNYPTVSNTGMACNNLTINSGAVVTIAPTGNLTVNGTLTNSNGNAGLVLKSTASGTGSLMHNTANVPGTMERYIQGSASLTDMRYHFVSVPLVTANNSLSSLFYGSYLYNFNEGTNLWVALGSSTSTALDETRGYMVYYPGASTTYQFAGNLNSGAFTALTTKTGQGFNLVPNPYPSPIDWDASSGWTKTNIGGAIYIWPGTNASASTVNYATYVSGTGGTNGGSRYVPEGQSFFVVASAASPVLTMGNGVRVHNAQAFYAPQTLPANSFNLQVFASDVESADEVLIHFNPESTSGYDLDVDAQKFPGGEKAPQLSMLAPDNTRLTINSMPETSSAIIPLEFSHFEAAPCTFNAFGMETFGNQYDIWLDDTYLGKSINFRQQSSYTFDHLTTDALDRFRLRISGNGITGLGEKAINRIYRSGSRIIVDVPGFTGTHVSVNVYNTAGQQVWSGQNTGSKTFGIPLPASAGIYLLTATDGQHSLSEKIVVD